MQSNDRLIKAFMQAGADLLQHALTQLQAEDPPAAAGLQRMLRSGAVMELKAQLAPASGLARLQIDALPLHGEPLQVCAVELQRHEVQ